jgi:uncharacterized protein (TIGR02145 family)
MRSILLLFSIFIISFSFAQSKKEQIEILNKLVDSLTITLDTERINQNQTIVALNSKVQSLEGKISEMKIESEKQMNLNKLSLLANDSLQNRIKVLQNEIQTKNDSLIAIREKNGQQKNISKNSVNNSILKNNTDGYIILLDGYRTIKISNQIWMVDNLNVDKFRNGDPIPEARTKEEWEKARKDGKPAWCYYDNDSKNSTNNGKLYNWYAVNDPRGIAPSGWHVPTQNEWESLNKNLGSDAGRKLKTTQGWNNWEEDVSCTNCKNASAECKVCKGTGVSSKKINGGNGLNTLNFCGIPSGSRGANGVFSGIGGHTVWWNVNENGLEHAGYFGLNSSSNSLSGGTFNKGRGLSLRCIKN